MKIYEQSEKKIYGNDCILYKEVSVITTADGYVVMEVLKNSTIGRITVDTDFFESEGDALDRYRELVEEFDDEAKQYQAVIWDDESDRQVYAGPVVSREEDAEDALVKDLEAEGEDWMLDEYPILVREI